MWFCGVSDARTDACSNTGANTCSDAIANARAHDGADDVADARAHRCADTITDAVPDAAANEPFALGAHVR